MLGDGAEQIEETDLVLVEVRPSGLGPVNHETSLAGRYAGENRGIPHGDPGPGAERARRRRSRRPCWIGEG